MRIRLSQLRRIIKEEVKRTLREASADDLDTLDADIKKDMKPGGNNYYEGTAEQAARSYNDSTENITNRKFTFEEVVDAFVKNNFESDGSEFDDE